MKLDHYPITKINKNIMKLELCNDPYSNGPIHFYEIKHYWLSNFSSFGIWYLGNYYQTVEHAYQADKFRNNRPLIWASIKDSPSAHEAMKFAHANKDKYDSEWESRKLNLMKYLVRLKHDQHAYIQDKLIITGNRELIEASPIDSYWGWGPNKDGENHLGKIWMDIRSSILK